MTSTIELFNQLSNQLNGRDQHQEINYTKCVDLCNKICGHGDANDQDALKVKCICLIRLGKFDKALEVAMRASDLAFEQAYCHYRLKQVQDALFVLNTMPGPKSEAAMHLEAQCFYRMRKYDTCIDLYQALRKEEASPEVRVNLCAAYTSANRGENILEDDKESETYEVAYNRACAFIQNKQFETAEGLLLRSEELCTKSLTDEGFTENEIQTEISTIKVQLAFVYQQSGHAKKAQELYQQVIASKLNDEALIAVASNNIVVMNKDKDIFASFKRLKNIPLDTIGSRLSPLQHETISANSALLLCMLNKGRECRAYIEKLKQNFPDSSISLKIMAALLLREKNYDGCIHFLQTEASSVTNAKGIRSTSVVQLMQGIFKLSKGMHQEAATAFRHLVDDISVSGECRTRACALLVFALSQYDGKSAEQSSILLPLIEGDTIDAEEYEKAAIRLSKTSMSKMMAKMADSDTKKRDRKLQAKNPEKLHRKRSRRREKYLALLKSKNPSIGLVKPDPERWIPRKQRSYAKRGRRGRNKFVGAQGSGMGGEKDALKLDAAARVQDEQVDVKGVVAESKTTAAQRKSRKKKRRN